MIAVFVNLPFHARKWHAVVGGHDDQRVIELAALFQHLEHTADLCVPPLDLDGIVREVPAPLNILGTPNAPTLKQMAALGVRRVTFGSAPMRATLGLVRRMAREWKEKGTYGTLEAYGIPFAELQKLFA